MNINSFESYCCTLYLILIILWILYQNTIKFILISPFENINSLNLSYFLISFNVQTYIYLTFCMNLLPILLQFKYIGWEVSEWKWYCTHLLAMLTSSNSNRKLLLVL